MAALSYGGPSPKNHEWSGLQQSIVDYTVDQWRKMSLLLSGNKWPSLQTFDVTLQLELV